MAPAAMDGTYAGVIRAAHGALLGHFRSRLGLVTRLTVVGGHGRRHGSWEIGRHYKPQMVRLLSECPVPVDSGSFLSLIFD
jgi:hypothetical protein